LNFQDVWLTEKYTKQKALSSAEVIIQEWIETAKKIGELDSRT